MSFYKFGTFAFCLLLALQVKLLFAEEHVECQRQLTPQEQLIFSESELTRMSLNRNAWERLILRKGKKPLTNHILKVCSNRDGCTEKDVAEATRLTVLEVSRISGQAKGYAVLIGAMVGSAALASHLTEMLPDSAKFLSQLVGQLSAIGIYVLGAPIWEPISSGFRKWAFGFSTSTEETSLEKQDRAGLEKQWQRTQAQFSQNAQMSRNILNNFIVTTHQNFRAAYQAIEQSDDSKSTEGLHYAIDQIAEAAIRMRTLFADISPDDPNVSRAVHATFARHIKNSESLYESAITRIYELDPDGQNLTNKSYYQKVLKAWLFY